MELVIVSSAPKSTYFHTHLAGTSWVNIPLNKRLIHPDPAKGLKELLVLCAPLMQCHAKQISIKKNLYRAQLMTIDITIP